MYKPLKYYFNKQSACEVLIMDLTRQRRVRKNWHDRDFYPKGILDVVQNDYPDRYFLMSKDSNRTSKIFSREEWVDILTKSRNSHENQFKRIKKQKNM